MKSFRINIDTVFEGDDNSPKIAEFIEQFSQILYAGKGGLPTFLKSIKITADFPLRCIVGIPEDDFTPAKRLLAEAFCQHFLNLKSNELWTSERLWIPTNPLRIDAPLDQCIFDKEWMMTFGLSISRWENDVLICTSALARQERLPHRDGIFQQNARLLLALAVYGFADPWQFFTYSKYPQ